MQSSFFDEAISNEGGLKSKKFLSEMKSLIPFKEIESLLIKHQIYKPNEGKAGRPSVKCNILVGSLFLQNWYGLSDPMTEELIHDRISFREFLDIKLDDKIPDETTICKFRNKLIAKNLLSEIFDLVLSQMKQNNLILNQGTLVDATLIHSSEPKKKKNHNGKTISNKAHDSEASYVSKRGHKHHGLKMHIATDRRGIIKKVIATTAKAHDSTEFDNLTVGENNAVFGDSGYMSKDRKKNLRHNGVFVGIIERRVKNQSKLRTKQSKNNQRFAKIRSVVELPFAFIKHHMNFRVAKYIGIAKNQEHFSLLATCYNLRRIPALMRK